MPVAIFALKFAPAMMKFTLSHSDKPRLTKGLWALFLALGLIGTVQASGSGGDKPNPGEFIIHHIADAHDVHLWGDGPSALHIPLPIIAYVPGHGVDVFSSAHLLHHGEDHVDESDHGMGDPAHSEHEGHGHEADHGHGAGGYHSHKTHLTYHLDGNGVLHAEDHDGEAAQIYDLSISKSVFGMFLVIFLMLLVFPRIGSAYKKRKGQAPKGLQNALEPLILFIRDEVAVPSIGEKKAGRYLPFLLTVFFFIFFCNLLGLIPFIGGFNVTGTVGVTLTLATFVFIITTVSGNKHYWGHILWPPGVPLPIKFILVPVEVVGILLKPTVLMIRLTANIGAGHIIILALTFLVFIISDYGQHVVAGVGTGIFSVAFMIFMYFIELLVAFLQAYVFTLLAALYFGDATQEAHH